MLNSTQFFYELIFKVIFRVILLIIYKVSLEYLFETTKPRTRTNILKKKHNRCYLTDTIFLLIGILIKLFKEV